jgi:hypothetical protein
MHFVNEILVNIPHRIDLAEDSWNWFTHTLDNQGGGVRASSAREIKSITMTDARYKMRPMSVLLIRNCMVSLGISVYPHNGELAG